ncbi:MAG: hypothetical protein JWL59_3901 [Chthoniobacteraceae bacterium]|nr:hypothetical protein [Chthoniobacteraceae bacterium]
MFGILKWTLLLSAFSAVILAGLAMIENWRGEKVWTAYRARAARDGTKLDLAAFLQAPLRDVENFTAHPLFNEIFEKPKAAMLAKAQLALPAERKPATFLGGFPGQGFVDLTVWRDYFVHSKFLADPGPTAAGDVLLALERFSPLLDSLHKAGLQPTGQFPVPWNRGFEAELSHLGIFQNATTLRALRLSARLNKRESAAAYEEWHDILRMYRAIQNEPSLIAGLVRISFLSQLCSAVRIGLKDEAWDSVELGKMAADLAALNVLEDYTFAVQSERALLNQHLDQIGAAPFWQRHKLIKSTSEDILGIGPDALPFEPWLERWMPAGWHRQNQLAANHCIDTQLARVDLPAQRFDLSDESPASSDWLLQRNPRRFCFGFLRSANVYGGIEKRYVSTWTVVQLARIAIALEQFRSAHEYPETLEALVPSYLPSLPRELFADLPFLYRKTEDGRFFLYSRALNQKDDGGSSDLKKTVTQQSDWVWSYQAARP